MKNKIPKVGDTIYLETELYLSHGIDDLIGGKVKVVKTEKKCGNYYVITDIDLQAHYSWSYLSEKQEELKERFCEQKAYHRPDNRPEFNDYF